MPFGVKNDIDQLQEISKLEQTYAHAKPTNFRDLLKVKALQHEEGQWFRYSLNGLTVLGGFSSCCMYLMFRRALTLYEGLIAGSAVMGAFGCGFTQVLRNRILHPQILTGKVDCAPCAMIRGGVYQTIPAVGFPFAIAFAMSAMIAEKYGYIKVPPFGFQRVTAEFRSFWYPKFRRVGRWSVPLVVVNAAAGAFCAYKELEASKAIRRYVTQEDVDKMMSDAYRFADNL